MSNGKVKIAPGRMVALFAANSGETAVWSAPQFVVDAVDNGPEISREGRQEWS
jgi:hypothetical protein